MVGRRVSETTEALWSLIEELRKQGIDRLPPEAELSKSMDVSRATLRDGLAQVELAGGIVRRPRLGTRITPGPSRWTPPNPAGFPVHLILSLSEYLTQAGIDYSVEELRVRTMRPLPEVARALGLRRDSRVYDVTRTYLVHGEPAAFLQHYVPQKLAGHSVHINDLTEGVTTFLTDIEHVEGLHGDSRITAEVAGEVLARQLRTAVGAPLLVLYARLYGRDSVNPVTLGRLVFLPEIISFTVTSSGGLNAETARNRGRSRPRSSTQWSNQPTQQKGRAR